MIKLKKENELIEARRRYMEKVKELTEMEKKYDNMLYVLSDILTCGTDDIEELFSAENNIEVGEIIKRYVENTGELPSWNTVYYEALDDFASENDLKIGVDVDIYTNCSLDTHIYAKEGLDENIVNKLEELFNMEVETLQ